MFNRIAKLAQKAEDKLQKAKENSQLADAGKQAKNVFKKVGGILKDELPRPTVSWKNVNS